MSRRIIDCEMTRHFVVMVDWSNHSRFHRNEFGFRLILIRGWNLYAVHEVSGRLYVYDTEQWTEWKVRMDVNLEDMFLYTHWYPPRALFADHFGTHLTLETFLSRLGNR